MILLSMLFFYLLVCLSVFGYGVWARSPVIIALSGVLFLGLGVHLMSGEQIEHVVGSKITYFEDQNAWDVNYVYNNRTVGNDLTVLILSNLLFYGGFAVIVIGFGVYYFRLRM